MQQAHILVLLHERVHLATAENERKAESMFAMLLPTRTYETCKLESKQKLARNSVQLSSEQRERKKEREVAIYFHSA